MNIGEYFQGASNDDSDLLCRMTDGLLDEGNSAFKAFRDWPSLVDACWTVIERNAMRPFVDRSTLGMLISESMAVYNRKEPGNRWPPVWLAIKKELSKGGELSCWADVKKRQHDNAHANLWEKFKTEVMPSAEYLAKTGPERMAMWMDYEKEHSATR